MYRTKYFKLLLLILVFTLFLMGCKKDNLDEVQMNSDITGIVDILMGIEDESIFEGINELIDEMADIDTEEKIKLVEVKLIGVSSGKMPDLVVFGHNYKDFEYKDELIEFMGKTWNIVPFYNYHDSMSAVFMDYKYDYKGANPEVFKKDIQALISDIISEYGVIMYAQNPTFEEVSELDDDKVYMVFEGDDFYLASYVINVPDREEVYFSLVYFSKEYPHPVNGEYSVALSELEKAIEFKKGYIDLLYSFVQPDGLIINYSKNFQAEPKKTNIHKILTRKLPPLENDIDREEEISKRYITDYNIKEDNE